jgi:Leucine-rich repeat (LRR) protein
MNNISNNDKAQKGGAIKEQQSPSMQEKSKQILAPMGPSSDAFKDNDRKPPANTTVGAIMSVSESEDSVQDQQIRHKARQFRAGSKGGGTDDTASVVSPATSASRLSSESAVGAFSFSGSSSVQEQRIRHKARQSRAGSNDSISITGLQHSSEQEQSLPSDAVPGKDSLEDDVVGATSLLLTPRDSVPVVNPSGNSGTSTASGAKATTTAPGAVAVVGIEGSSADATIERSPPPPSSAVHAQEGTVTTMAVATAVSSEDLENEVRQRIMLESVIANVECIPEDVEETNKPWYRRNLVVLLLVMLLAAVVVAVVITLDATSGTPTSPPTIPPTSPPTPAPTGRPTAAPSFRPSGAPTSSQPTTEPVSTPQREDLLNFLVSKSLDGGVALRSLTSPQRNAFRFLAESPEIMPFEEPLIDFYTMATLFYSTNGGSWANTANWLTPEPVCTWFGVQCAGSRLGSRRLGGGLITGVNLASNNLIGQMPPELGLLSSRLASLDLSKNMIVGRLPSETALLAGLTTLNLGRNGLSGSLPSQIGEMKSIERFFIHSNKFSDTIPVEIGLWTNLRSARFENNEFTGVMPSEICLIGLQQLTVDCAEVVCDCCSSQCTEAPTSTPSTQPSSQPSSQPTAEPVFTSQQEDLLNFLVSRSLDGGAALSSPTSPQRNAFRFLAESPEIMPFEEPLIDFYTMASLFYSTNGGFWANTTNWLTPEPVCTWFGVQCAGSGLITAVNLASNNLLGQMPPELGLLSSRLTSLDLSSNMIVGRLPSETTLLAGLTTLNLSRNGLSGPLPSQIGEMKSIEKFFINNNKFSDTIPVEIGLWSNLRSARFDNNDFTGDMPSEICLIGPQQLTVDCGEVACDCCSSQCT